MARIRSVHPELFTDEAFASLGMTARVLLIGIWTQCDDHGIFEHKPLGLKMRIFPAENNIDMEVLLRELEDAKCIKPFEVDGRTYGAVRNFCLFQRPKKPTFKHPFPDQLRTYVALDRQKAEEVEDRSPTSGENRPHRRGEESREEEREKENLKPNSESVVVSVAVDKSENADNTKKTTTTTVSKGALQGKKAGLGAVIGRPLPSDWTPDDQLCEKVANDFGMSVAEVDNELPTFHALNVQNGTLSQDWSSTFYLFAKRWKERQARAAPRLELSKAPTERFVPTEDDFDKAVVFYAKTGRWPRDHGPDPTSPACKCPPHLLEKHLPNPAAIPVLAKVRA